MIRNKFRIKTWQIPKNTDMTPYWRVIEKIIKESDIIIEVLDARMPELSQNEQVEELAKKFKKELIFGLNKSDLVPEKQLRNKLRKLKKSGNAFILSSSAKFGISKLRDYIFNLAHGKEDFKIGILGYPNTGKSSLINALLRRHKVKVTSRAGTTHGQQWARLKENILIIDSPGVIPLGNDDEVKYALIGSRNVERIHNLEAVAEAIVNLFEEKNNFKKFYNISNSEDDFESLINAIALEKKFLKKGGIPDETRVWELIVRDWQSGKLNLKVN
ncbi:MAG: GTPase [Candidatus Pacearchaeota archaeon]